MGNQNFTFETGDLLIFSKRRRCNAQVMAWTGPGSSRCAKDILPGGLKYQFVYSKICIFKRSYYIWYIYIYFWINIVELKRCLHNWWCWFQPVFLSKFSVPSLQQMAIHGNSWQFMAIHGNGEIRFLKRRMIWISVSFSGVYHAWAEDTYTLET